MVDHYANTTNLTLEQICIFFRPIFHFCLRLEWIAIFSFSHSLQTFSSMYIVHAGYIFHQKNFITKIRTLLARFRCDSDTDSDIVFFSSNSFTFLPGFWQPRLCGTGWVTKTSFSNQLCVPGKIRITQSKSILQVDMYIYEFFILFTRIYKGTHFCIFF